MILEDEGYSRDSPFLSVGKEATISFWVTTFPARAHIPSGVVVLGFLIITLKTVFSPAPATKFIRVSNNSTKSRLFRQGEVVDKSGLRMLPFIY